MALSSLIGGKDVLSLHLTGFCDIKFKNLACSNCNFQLQQETTERKAHFVLKDSL